MKVVNPSFNKLMIGMGLIVVLLLIAIAWMAGSLIAKKSAQLKEGGQTQAVAEQSAPASVRQQAAQTEAVAEQAQQQVAAAPEHAAAQSDDAERETSSDAEQVTQRQAQAAQPAETAVQTAEAETDAAASAAQQEQTSDETAQSAPETEQAVDSARQAVAVEEENAVAVAAPQQAAQAGGSLASALSAEVARDLEALKKQSKAGAASGGPKKEIYVYLHGKLVKVDDIDVSKLTDEDLSYVEQLKKAAEEAEGKKPEVKPRVTGQQVKQAKADEGKKTGIQMNQIALSENAQPAGGLAAQLQQLAQSTAKVTVTQKKEKKEDEGYVSALGSIVKERENEVRYVRVKKGDTLWDIAVRAYGSGFMYPKIFKANPQLKSPDMLQVGILLRVPR